MKGRKGQIKINYPQVDNLKIKKKILFGIHFLCK